MIKAAGLGYPVRKSKSPVIYGHWCEKYGLEGRYDVLEVAPERLKSEIARLAEEGYVGFSITIPHKQAVMDLCDFVDDTARAIGATPASALAALPTISVSIRDGKLHATNTDWFGFAENFEDSCPGFDCSKGPVAVLGAGGAAKGVIYALLRLGFPEIRICNRTRERADALLAMDPSKIRIFDWEMRGDMLQGCALLTNTTSMGMEGQQNLGIALDHLPRDSAVYDIVYYPLQTPLLRAARERGNHTVTGIGMLLHQARPSFKNWFGVMPEVDEALRQKVAV